MIVIVWRVCNNKIHCACLGRTRGLSCGYITQTTTYDVDSPVCYIQLIEAVILKIKEIMYLLSIGVEQTAAWWLIVQAVHVRRLKVSFKTNDLAYPCIGTYC